MKLLLKAFAKNTAGATSIEYGLIAGLISVVVIGALTTIGTRLSNKFEVISKNLS